MFQQEIDRQNGYRPGVGMLYINSSRQVLLGCRQNWLSSIEMNEAGGEIGFTFNQHPDWMYGWDIPQGGIEPGETFNQAIRRETFEELGPEWVACLQGMKFLRREALNFPVTKDGIRWRGKTYYYNVLFFKGEPSGPPGDYIDWVYGPHQDEGPYPYPTMGFPGGVLFMNYREACEAIRKTQGGQKGRLVLNVLGQLKAQGFLN